jgi:hypothetical protein
MGAVANGLSEGEWRKVGRVATGGPSDRLRPKTSAHKQNVEIRGDAEREVDDENKEQKEDDVDDHKES